MFTRNTPDKERIRTDPSERWDVVSDLMLFTSYNHGVLSILYSSIISWFSFAFPKNSQDSYSGPSYSSNFQAFLYSRHFSLFCSPEGLKGCFLTTWIKSLGILAKSKFPGSYTEILICRCGEGHKSSILHRLHQEFLYTLKFKNHCYIFSFRIFICSLIGTLS